MFGELIFITEALEEMLDVHEQIVLALSVINILYIFFFSPIFFLLGILLFDFYLQGLAVFVNFAIVLVFFANNRLERVCYIIRDDVNLQKNML